MGWLGDRAVRRVATPVHTGLEASGPGVARLRTEEDVSTFLRGNRRPVEA
jgi:hypothetical protein